MPTYVADGHIAGKAKRAHISASDLPEAKSRALIHGFDPVSLTIGALAEASEPTPPIGQITNHALPIDSVTARDAATLSEMADMLREIVRIERSRARRDRWGSTVRVVALSILVMFFIIAGPYLVALFVLQVLGAMKQLGSL